VEIVTVSAVCVALFESVVGNAFVRQPRRMGAAKPRYLGDIYSVYGALPSSPCAGKFRQAAES